jgi:hypothetical protein
MKRKREKNRLIRVNAFLDEQEGGLIYMVGYVLALYRNGDLGGAGDGD